MRARVSVFVCLLLTVLLLTDFSEAQQPKKVPRIGFLAASSAPIAGSRIEAFRQGLRGLGYVEGKDIVIEYRFADGKPDQLPHYAAELVRLKVDIIITLGPMDTRAARDATKTIPIVMGQDSDPVDLIVVASTPAALAAKSATTTIPIVMAAVADPVGARLVGSLARPEGNLTGVSGLAFQLNTQRLEILKDAVPKLARVGLLLLAGGSQTIGRDLEMKELRPAAVALKLKLEELETQLDAKDLESAFQNAKQRQVKTIMTSANPRFFGERKTDRRACRETPAAGYLFPEGVCR